MLVDRLISLKEFVVQHPHLGTHTTLRRWIRTDYRGFSKCAVKCSDQTILIDLDALEEWLEAQRVNQLAEKKSDRTSVHTQP